MEIVVLSKHTEDMVRRGQQFREKDYLDRRNVHAGEVDRFRTKRKEIREETKNAWEDGNYVSFLVSGFKVAVNAFKKEPPPPVMAAETTEEKVWKSGKSGEDQLLQILGSQLGSEWTAVSGYNNRKGEADLILIGPPGVLGIEIKHLNGTINCNGDTWSRDKYDNYGNCVEWGIPIADRKGRSPAQQINDVCYDLMRFLNKRNKNPYFVTAVVLTHPKSWLGNYQNLTTYVCRADYFDINTCMQPGGSGLSQEDVSDLVELIIQDHNYHAIRDKARKRNHNTKAG